MLQQILNDMWVDPELLAELDDTQKQTLFCKMREEQIRRWTIWDSSDPPKPSKVKKVTKNVNFLLDVRGEPWTWVMGEHKDDRSIEQILEEETREAARLLAQQEALSFKMKMEAELDEILKLGKEQKEETKEKLESEGVYCSPDEIKLALKPKPKHIVPNSLKRDALQEIYLNKPHKVSQRVALWEKRLMDERTTEIYKTIQKNKMDAAKEAEEAENTQDQLWREQEKRAKEAEFKMREVARRAREEYKKCIQESTSSLSLLKKDSTTSLLKSGPLNREAIVEWFKSSEVNRRAGLEPNSDSVAHWFHGLITRQEAENLLQSQPVGSFLVRVSERIWGYAISYKDTDRCKHYLIDATNGHYQFLGTNQVSHKTLGDLVLYHGVTPITALGGEILARPCHRLKPLPTVFLGLSIRAR